MVRVATNRNLGCGHGFSVATMEPVARSLADFRDEHRSDRLIDAASRNAIVTVATELLQDFYVHLEMKRAGTALDPLKNLESVSAIARLMPTDREFHDRILDVFATLHDRHTLYSVPPPYRDRIAVLPFRVQRIGGGSIARYLVTAVTRDELDGVASEGAEPFARGVEVLTWNGRPLETVVQENASLMGGTHPDAKTAWGVAHLTDRPLTYTKLPEDDTVRLTYRRGDGEGAITLPWRVTTAPGAEARDGAAVQVKSAYGVALDRRLDLVRRSQLRRFTPADTSSAPGPAAAAPSPPSGLVPTSMPDLLQYRVLTRNAKRFGHLRIRSFDTALVTRFNREIRRLLEDHHPDDGLIIDVRGNPGGLLAAGERLLQLFTPMPIQPEGLQFAVTKGTEAVAAQAEFGAWRSSITEGEALGEELSAPRPIEPGYAESLNGVGQRYYGPVALLVDALCYSTTDAFAAGFKDHGIGWIIGIGMATGGGGGNPWSLEAIRHTSGRSLELPAGVSFDIAVRRNLRVGAASGTPIEQLGVAGDEIVELTADDVLNDNHDLLLHALEHLERQPSHGLRAALTFSGGVAAIDLQTRGIDDFDVYLDGRPVQAAAAANGRLTVRASPAASHVVQLYGFAGGALVAAWRERFGTGPALPVTTIMAPSQALDPTRNDARHEP
jgi:hypothetical protein